METTDWRLRCPISLKVMKYPVKTVNGFTYDKKSIQKWFATGNTTEPMTGQILHDLTLTENTELMQILIHRNTCESCKAFMKRPKRCSGCNIAWYCSTTCQKQHWKEHKPKCRVTRHALKK